nr:DUF3265 domain-containing protein [Vibrio navarrensis]
MIKVVCGNIDIASLTP